MADEMSPGAGYENLAYPDEELPYEGEAGGDARYANSLDSLNGDPNTARITFDAGTSVESSVDFSSLLGEGIKTAEKLITAGINAGTRQGGPQSGGNPPYGYTPPATQLPYVQIPGGGFQAPSTGQVPAGTSATASTQALATAPTASSTARTVLIVVGAVGGVALAGAAIAAASRSSRRRRTMDF